MTETALHPDNTDFIWEDHTAPFTTVSPAQAEAYDRDGFFLVEGALSGAVIEAATAETDRLVAQQEELIRSQFDGTLLISRADEIVFAIHLVAVSETLAALARAEVLAGLAADLCGPDPRLYWDQAVYKKPGTERHFPWHQDNGYTFVEPQSYLTCWCALTEATVDNGCPWVLPGMHRRGTLAHRFTELGFVCFEGAEGAVPVEAAAGDIVVFSSLTPHRTGPNLTDEIRKSYILQYTPDGAFTRHGEAVVRCDDPDRQFPVARGGRPLAG